MNQAYSRLSTTHDGHIHRLQVGFGGVCRCMRGDLMWTCLVWAERSTGWILLPEERRLKKGSLLLVHNVKPLEIWPSEYGVDANNL